MNQKGNTPAGSLLYTAIMTTQRPEKKKKKNTAQRKNVAIEVKFSSLNMTGSIVQNWFLLNGAVV